MTRPAASFLISTSASFIASLVWLLETVPSKAPVTVSCAKAGATRNRQTSGNRIRGSRWGDESIDQSKFPTLSVMLGRCWLDGCKRDGVEGVSQRRRTVRLETG